MKVGKGGKLGRRGIGPGRSLASFAVTHAGPLSIHTHYTHYTPVVCVMCILCQSGASLSLLFFYIFIYFLLC